MSHNTYHPTHPLLMTNLCSNLMCFNWLQFQNKHRTLRLLFLLICIFPHIKAIKRLDSITLVFTLSSIQIYLKKKECRILRIWSNCCDISQWQTTDESINNLGMILMYGNVNYWTQPGFGSNVLFMQLKKKSELSNSDGSIPWYKSVNFTLRFTSEMCAVRPLVCCDSLVMKWLRYLFSNERFLISASDLFLKELRNGNF